MPMLSADDLRASPIVANATMNRGRGFSGVNSYERELRFDISQFLAERVQEQGKALWLDVCCGEGCALIEAGAQFAAFDWGKNIEIIGMDLVAMFAQEKAPGVSLVSADVMDFTLNRPADLITCVHGLHYLGDKLGFLEKAYAMLSAGGLFLGQLDTQNLRSTNPTSRIWTAATRRARQNGVFPAYNKHLVQIERTHAALSFGVRYAGATPSEIPNYTSITVIDSWYEVIK